MVESTGIPTVTLSVVRSMTEATPAPRNVFLRFRLGQVLGEPGDVAQQQAVLRSAFGALEAIVETGAVVELPLRWKRERYPPPVGIIA